ncbi:MAG: hypothetical protein U0T74_03195 [Chitinophagales bacterium]
MKHVKTKMLGLMVVVALLLCGNSGCRKMYKCSILGSSYLVCNKGLDTLRYFAAGYDDYMEIIKTQKENDGYSCYYFPDQMVGLTILDNVEKQNVSFLESKGYKCLEKKE